MANNAGDEEVKTLFLSGLPDDIKEREIYNLFRIHKGYESCQLKYSGRGYQIVAFAVFTDQQSALAAKEALNGLKFDPQTGATLHIELARANSRTKRTRSEDSVLGTMEKKYRGPIGTPGAYPDPGVAGTVHLPGMVHTVYNDMSGFPPPQSGGMAGPPLYSGQEGLSSMMLGPSLIPPPPAPGSNPPCSTLFIANLGQTCTEDELIQVLSRFPGYRKIKMQIKGGLPVAFVEFQDVMCSTQALSQLQNSMLSSSDRGGMRLEYPFTSVVLAFVMFVALMFFDINFCMSGIGFLYYKLAFVLYSSSGMRKQRWVNPEERDCHRPTCKHWPIPQGSNAFRLPGTERWKN